MRSSRDAFGTPRRTDAIVPCGAAIFIIRMRGVAVCSKAYSRSGFACPARDTMRRARHGSVAMCGSTHRRGRCLFIIASSWRPAMKRGRHRAQNGSPGHRDAGPKIAVVRDRPVARLHRRGDRPVRLLPVETCAVADRAGRAVMLHRTARGRASGARCPAPEPVGGKFAKKRLRGAMSVITTCNGRAARAPAQGDAATRRRARLCGPDAWSHALLGDFGENRR